MCCFEWILSWVLATGLCSFMWNLACLYMVTSWGAMIYDFLSCTLVMIAGWIATCLDGCCTWYVGQLWVGCQLPTFDPWLWNILIHLVDGFLFEFHSGSVRHGKVWHSLVLHKNSIVNCCQTGYCSILSWGYEVSLQSLLLSWTRSDLDCYTYFSAIPLDWWWLGELIWCTAIYPMDC